MNMKIKALVNSKKQIKSHCLLLHHFLIVYIAAWWGHSFCCSNHITVINKSIEKSQLSIGCILFSNRQA